MPWELYSDLSDDDPQERWEREADASWSRAHAEARANDRYIPYMGEVDDFSGDEDAWSEENSDWDYSESEQEYPYEEEWSDEDDEEESDENDEEDDEDAGYHSEDIGADAAEDVDSDSQSVISIAMSSRSRKRARLLSVKSHPSAKVENLPGKNPLDCLPEELIYMIFGNVEPMDLLNLARTSKTYWKILTTSSLSSLWKLVRERSQLRGRFASPPPLGVSETRWTALLHDHARCWECHSKHKRAHLLVTIVRRLCTHCLKKLTTRVRTEWEFGERFPSYDKALMQLLPLKNVRSLSKLGATYCIASEVEALSRRYNAYRLAVGLKMPEAPGAFEAFKSTTREKAASLLEAAYILRTWDSDWRVAEAKRQLEEIAADMRAEYTDEDGSIDFVLARFNDKTIRGSLASSSRYDWHHYSTRQERLSTQFKDAIKDAVAHRAAQRRDNIILRRATLAETLYSEHIARLSPLLWPTLPRLDDIVLPQAFLREIHNTHGGDTPEHDEGLAAALPSLIDSAQVWAMERRADIQRLNPTSPNADDVGSVYICHCRDGGLLLGVAEALAHRCPVPPGRDNRETDVVLPGWTTKSAKPCSGVQYSVAGCAALTQLRGLVGESDLDACDARFVCITCPPARNQRMYGRHALEWRQSVYHHATASRRTHGTPRFRLLSPDEKVQVNAQQNKPGAAFRWSEHWACGMCSAHFSTHVAHNEVREHLEKEHFIADPQEDQHFIWLSGCAKPRGDSVWFPVASLSQIKNVESKTRCLLCASAGSAAAQRVFSESGVRQHMTAKHGVQVEEQEQGTHFAVVDA